MEKDSHTFKKAALQLKFVCREEEEKQRYKLNQLAIHGLPEGVEGEVLEVIIGDRLELEEGDDFSLEVSGDQTAVITFPKDYSVEGTNSYSSTLFVSSDQSTEHTWCDLTAGYRQISLQN